MNAVAAPDVSVCIVNWNCREVLRNCLTSLCHCCDVRLEVIVVDNGSTDGAADMVAAEFPNVILIRNPDNRGFSKANNQAAAVARGQYLFFLNNDTVVPPDTIRRLFIYAEQHPEISLLGPKLRDAKGAVQVSCRKRPTVSIFLHRTLLFRWQGGRAYREYRRMRAGDEPLGVEFLLGAALFVSREKYDRFGGWDESFTFGGEDLEICLRAEATGPIVYHPGIELTHLGRTSTRQHLKYTSVQIPAGFVLYFRKAGSSAAGLWMYKLGLTLDAPFQLIDKGVQYLWRRLRGRKTAATSSLTALRSTIAFVSRGLLPLWRA